MKSALNSCENLMHCSFNSGASELLSSELDVVVLRRNIAAQGGEDHGATQSWLQVKGT